MMRLLTLGMCLLCLLIQYPLWLGKGGWLRVMELESQVALTQEKNESLKLRNAKLAVEVQDLRQGVEAVEERARHDLGLIKEGEFFVGTVSAGHSLHIAAPQP